MKNILSIMDKHITVPVDKKLLKRIDKYVTAFERKNEDHINFLGGNLLGVYSFKFVSSDEDNWIVDILELDDIRDLTIEIHDLESVDARWNIAGSITNISMMYLCHKALVSKVLNSRDREKMAERLLLMFQYKVFTSIHTWYYSKGASLDVALATYEKLSNKFSLKRAGSWGELFKVRTNDILSKKSIWYKTLHTFNDDKKVVDMMNDIQGRFKSILNILTDNLYEVIDEDAKISSMDKFITVDGDRIIKDTVTDTINIRRNMLMRIRNRNDFIRDDVVDAILSFVPTASRKQLIPTLEYISDNIDHDETLKSLVNNLLIYTFDTLRRSNIPLKSVTPALFKMRGLVKGSRIIDSRLITIRNDATDIVEKATTTRDRGVVSSTKIAFLLYIILLALLK